MPLTYRMQKTFNWSNRSSLFYLTVQYISCNILRENQSVWRWGFAVEHQKLQRFLPDDYPLEMRSQQRQACQCCRKNNYFGRSMSGRMCLKWFTYTFPSSVLRRHTFRNRMCTIGIVPTKVTQFQDEFRYNLDNAK